MVAATESADDAFTFVFDVPEASAHDVPASDTPTIALKVEQAEDDDENDQGADGNSNCQDFPIKTVFWGRKGLSAPSPQLDHGAIYDSHSLSGMGVVFSNVKCQIVVCFSVEPVIFSEEAHKTQGAGHLRRDVWGFSFCVIDKSDSDHNGRVD